MITAGRWRSTKGDYALSRAELDQAELQGCLALYVPPPDRPCPDPDLDPERACFAARFRDCTWLAVELLRDGRDVERLQELTALGRRHGLPLTAAGGVRMHARGRRALLDLFTAIRRKQPVGALGPQVCSNGERHPRELDELAELYPASLLAESTRIAARCQFSLGEIRYQHPDDVTHTGETPSEFLRRLTEQGLIRRWPQGVPAKVRTQVEHELELIAELGYEACFLWSAAPGLPRPGRSFRAAGQVECEISGLSVSDSRRT